MATIRDCFVAVAGGTRRDAAPNLITGNPDVPPEAKYSWASR
jgi:hypothetical protein